MPRSAPTVNGTPTYRRVSFSWIDATGDVRTDSIDVTDAAVTDVEIEALAVALAAISNADLYKVEVSMIYGAIQDKSNATNAPRASIYQNLATLAKTPTNLSKRGFVPAPVDAIFVTGTDQIDPISVPLGNYFTALLAVFGGGWNIASARYTERREINNAVKI